MTFPTWTVTIHHGSITENMAISMNKFVSFKRKFDSISFSVSTQRLLHGGFIIPHMKFLAVMSGPRMACHAQAQYATNEH